MRHRRQASGPGRSVPVHHGGHRFIAALTRRGTGRAQISDLRFTFPPCGSWLRNAQRTNIGRASVEPRPLRSTGRARGSNSNRPPTCRPRRRVGRPFRGVQRPPRRPGRVLAPSLRSVRVRPAPFEQPTAAAPSNGCLSRPTGSGPCCAVTLSPDNERATNDQGPVSISRDQALYLRFRVGTAGFEPTTPCYQP
jgi:hypothetical protein